MSATQTPADKKTQKRIDDANSQLAGDVQASLGHDEGRRLIAHLKDQFGVGLPIFVTSAHRRIDDPIIDAAVRDGNHEVIRYLNEILDLSYKTK